jgi:hypothetical protein
MAYLVFVIGVVVVDAADSMLAAGGFYNGTTPQLKGFCP